jgi:hypothetical protein
MGLRFRRSINLGHGVRINVSKSGVGLSAGAKGARVSVGPRGVRKSVGIPGTGIYYSTQKSLKQGQTHSMKDGSVAASAAAEAKRADREARIDADVKLADDLSKIKLGPWYKLAPCAVSALFIIPPLGIVLMWAFSKWSASKKILISIPAAVWTFIWGVVAWFCSPYMEILLAVLYAAVVCLQIRKIKLKLYHSMCDPHPEG